MDEERVYFAWVLHDRSYGPDNVKMLEDYISKPLEDHGWIVKVGAEAEGQYWSPDSQFRESQVFTNIDLLILYDGWQKNIANTAWVLLALAYRMPVIFYNANTFETILTEAEQYSGGRVSYMKKIAQDDWDNIIGQKIYNWGLGYKYDRTDLNGLQKFRVTEAQALEMERQAYLLSTAESNADPEPDQEPVIPSVATEPEPEINPDVVDIPPYEGEEFIPDDPNTEDVDPEEVIPEEVQEAFTEAGVGQGDYTEGEEDE